MCPVRDTASSHEPCCFETIDSNVRSTTGSPWLPREGSALSPSGTSQRGKTDLSNQNLVGAQCMEENIQVHYWLLGARTSVGFPQLFITIICHQFPGACSMHVTSAQPAGLLCSLLAGALSQATLNLLTSGSVGPARSRAQDSAVSRCGWGGHSPRAQHLPGLGFVPCSAWGGGGGTAGDGHVEKGSCWGHHCPAHGRSLCGVWQVSV